MKEKSEFLVIKPAAPAAGTIIELDLLEFDGDQRSLT